VVPADVAHQLRATDPGTADKKDISRAFRALHGIGGNIMMWAQREAYTAKKVPLEDMRFIFETVRDHVLHGRADEAVQFTKDALESFM
jgi:hypothetical protein